jgi:hypothetical protein
LVLGQGVILTHPGHDLAARGGNPERILAAPSLSLGFAVGWWRGPRVGFATGIGVLVAAVVGYVVVFSLSLPM